MVRSADVALRKNTRLLDMRDSVSSRQGAGLLALAENTREQSVATN
jgi:hypothetical protein